MTIDEIAKVKDVDAASVKKAIHRLMQNPANLEHLDIPDGFVPNGGHLPEKLADRLLKAARGKKPENGPASAAPEPDPDKRPETPRRLKKTRIPAFGLWLIRIAVACLGFRASFGVYTFAAELVPWPVALIESCSLELTYIGLTFIGLEDSDGRRATWIAVGALFVSVLYNTLASALMQDGQIFSGLSGFWFWLVSTLHGAPLAILAYLVSDMLFHRNKTI